MTDLIFSPEAIQYAQALASAERIALMIRGHLAGKAIPLQESTLSAEVEHVFMATATPYRREAVLSDADRVDFLVGTIAVELKVRRISDGDLDDQLGRYAESRQVSGLVLVAPWGPRLPRYVIYGKPVLLCIHPGIGRL